MRHSFLPRWKLTDSCGPKAPPGFLSCGCSHHNVFGCDRATRRKFMATSMAAVGLGGHTTFLGLGRDHLRRVADSGSSAQYSPPPPVVSPFVGLLDTHTHSEPDVFGRSLDDDEMAETARQKQMEAIVLKNHVVSTADRAWFARKHSQGFRVYGGIVLNTPVGGLNPAAAEYMWRMQGRYGRVVWMPTFDADNHVKYFKDGSGGIKIVDDGGQVLPAVRDVLKVAKQHDLVVQTGHISATEALAVIAAGRDMGIEKLVVTHAQLAVVNMSIDQMKQAASMGAKLELCAVGSIMGPEATIDWMKEWRRVTIGETAAAIQQVGAEHFVLGTDLGQTGNPSPADGLQLFVVELMKAGIPHGDIVKMGRENTGKILLG